LDCRGRPSLAHPCLERLQESAGPGMRYYAVDLNQLARCGVDDVAIATLIVQGDISECLFVSVVVVGLECVWNI